MIEADLKVHGVTKLQSLIDNTVIKKVHHLLKGTHEKALTSTYTGLNQIIEQATANAIYIGAAYDQIKKKAGKLAETRNFT